jgi:hypothetical protein
MLLAINKHSLTKQANHYGNLNIEIDSVVMEFANDGDLSVKIA